MLQDFEKHSYVCSNKYKYGKWIGQESWDIRRSGSSNITTENNLTSCVCLDTVCPCYTDEDWLPAVDLAG